VVARSIVDDDLVTLGRIARLEITGRRSGATRRVAVGFVEADDGSLIVAARSPEAAWAANLEAAGSADLVIGDRSMRVDAELLEPGDRRRAAGVRDLILRYGTPSEALGRGPVFRLVPRAR
jgi:deazaflavin-dependent oxidoreductase (nitroreductase family)